ncbi:hypothetical protein GS398_16145 [Pedobacter sp. HMF7056]|uniref:Uncharacterized protein n=1 Tax=Hufsiella ginkgonis TaxID=2695274 RepID=A0A7K1Y0M7_9SPHI|nr:DUF6706 family protein [Hufsiella ginkgonis]MXV16834.1 hypothetical protein [Hufsiella ginkgonis]
MSDLAVDKALIDQSVDGNAIYTKDDEKSVDLSLARLLLSVILHPSSVTEGGYSLSIGQRDDFLNFRKLLLKKWGAPDTADLGNNDKIGTASPW